ncbi:MAG: hypothetical protein M3O23_09390 [Actinomycetota bacterium]|nr:hypothetical protein [Actinomycetota bacterium]
MAPRVTVSPPSAAVEALTIATCDVTVDNPGPDADEFSFEALGEAAEWSWFSPVTVAVPPGGCASARASIRLPRAPRPPAGPYSFGVKAISVRDPGVSAVGETTLEVAAYTDLYLTLDPRRSVGARGEHVACVENRGNSPMATRLRAEAGAGPVEVAVEPPSVVAPPGGTATATVTVTPTRRPGRGGDGAHAFHVVADADGHPSQRVDGAFEPEPARSRRRSLTLLAVVVVVALVAGTAALVAGGSSDDEGSVGSTDVEAAAVTPANASCPAEGHLNRDRRATGELPFSYSFLFADAAGCTPWRFDPCRPVHYVTNAALAPAGALDDLREAFARISKASGMEFVHDGPTEERWSADRPPYQPERYGDRWAPILVSWSALGNQGRNDVIIAGRGNPVPVDGVLVTGHLDLNVDARTDQARTTPLENGFGEGITWGRVMLHELSHVFGLGHVQSTSNIMHEELTEHTLRTAEFGIGDLQAYRVIGREAGCVQVPAVRPVTADVAPPTPPPTIRTPG